MDTEQILEFFTFRERQCRIERRALEIWLGLITPLRWFTVVGGIVFSAIGGATIFTKLLGESATIVCGSFALLASILTSLHTGLKCDEHQTECSRLINVYSGLEAAYQAARLFSPADLPTRHAQLEERFEEAKTKATASVPSRYRRRAERELQAG